MRIFIAILAIAGVITSCNQISKEQDKEENIAFAKAETQQSPYASYGAKITAENAVKSTNVAETYASLKTGDTATIKFEAPINSVCAKKGCWMRLGAGEEEVFVKFKDYGFFVPLDATGEAVVEGKAYLEEVSVDELKHMAEDAGKSAEEIAQITEPKREMRFMADGVLIKSE